MMHFHRFGKWEDVAQREVTKGHAMIAGIVFVHEIIKQQRRCSVCNLVRTRSSA